MAGTRAPFASLAALAAVASAQAEQPGAAAAETAKKDLQLLPAVQRPAETSSGRSLFSGSSAVTGLSIGTPAAPGGAQNNKEEAIPGKSANWLLDGVNQLEAEAKAQRVAAGGNVSDGDSKLSNAERLPSAASATANPFTGYLTQWLSPEDQALLKTPGRNTSSSSTAPWERPRSDFRREATAPAQSVSNPLQMELPGLADLPANRTAQNPYLTEAFQAESTILGARAGSADGRDAPRAQPSILTPSQTVLPSVASSPAPVEQAKASSAAAPTERLIDDRKYFPQLRRF